VNTHPHRRSYRTVRHGLFTLLVAIGLMFSLAPSASTAAPVVSLDLQFFDAIGSGTSLYLVSPDAVLHSPEGEFVGRSGLTQFGDELESSFSNVAFSTKSVETAGSLTIISFTLTGINTGEYRGMVSNCAGISVPGVAVLQTSQTDPSSDGEFWQSDEALNRVAEQWVGYDTDAITNQIASFNQYYSSSSPGCAAYDLPQQDASDSVYEPAPSCNSPLDCRLPY
jgi:hypothetical protein